MAAGSQTRARLVRQASEVGRGGDDRSIAFSNAAISSRLEATAVATGALVLVLVGATILVSPAFFPREELIRVEYVFVAAPVAVVLLGALLYLHYRKHAKDT